MFFLQIQFVNTITANNKKLTNYKIYKIDKLYLQSKLHYNIMSVLNKPLVMSSMLFVTNVLHTHKKRRRSYAVSFVILTLTSSVNHAINTTDESQRHVYKSKLLVLIDHLAILGVVAVGVYNLKKISKHHKITSLLCCALCFLIYITSSMGSKGSSRAHLFLHIVASIGHHIIMNGI